jgi:hypothetical protein
MMPEQAVCYSMNKLSQWLCEENHVTGCNASFGGNSL